MTINQFSYILKMFQLLCVKIAYNISCIRQKEPRHENRDSSTNIDPNWSWYPFLKKVGVTLQ